MATSSSSAMLPESGSWQVFINFRGSDLRKSFISHLEGALKRGEIKYFIDNKVTPGEDLDTHYRAIDQSVIALSIFSSGYAESDSCLNELVRIMERVEEGKMKIIPVFFGVRPEEIKRQKGVIGSKLYEDTKRDRPNIPKWEKALTSVTKKLGLNFAGCRDEDDLVEKIVTAIKKQLTGNSYVSSVSSVVKTSQQQPKEMPSFEDEMNRRLEQLQEKIDVDFAETQIVGIVGMPGIGKTNLAERLFERSRGKFTFAKTFPRIRDKSQEHGSHWLMDNLLNGQEVNGQPKMFSCKILLVLDDVSHKNQVEFLLQSLESIRRGSKIVITTRDKSSIQELVKDNTYLVPGFNDEDALKLFNYHAFNDKVSASMGDFPKLSKKFVDYAGGNPRALEELGKELCGKNVAQWDERLEKLPHCCNTKILTELRVSYDKLTDQQKDAFLDIACFFRSEEEDYVKCLLDQYGSESGDDDAVKDLDEKLLICISAGRIEMHNLLCTFGKELGSSNENRSGERMWDYAKITDTLQGITSNQQIQTGTKKVRGIFLDTERKETGIPVGEHRFTETFNQKSLRYLKIYDSRYPQKCQVNLPDGLKFPFEEIRYLHWQNFQLEELPSDFIPQNLIDLRLPYSKIKRLWDAVKDLKELPQLKWVDLSYSAALNDLSALSKAFNLRRLNLEGCKILDKLPEEMNNMTELVFLNLRGCVMLTSLPKSLKLKSLKTLILSGCSSFKNFELVSKNLEFLHLDGTAITNLPETIRSFQKLVLLNLKNCITLVSLPDCLYELKSLEELILSGCSKLEKFPEIKENMEKMQILLLDGTVLQCGNPSDQIVEPIRMNSLLMLRRLCLSGNETIDSLQSSITQLNHLKWLDLRYCKNLKSLLKLPPNLQYLNAHACASLKTVESPLAFLTPTEQVSSSFIFTNCEKLEHSAKNEIICYAHNKSRLLSDALNRHNKSLAFENLVATCFPGSEVPVWFNHRASGAVLEPQLLPSDNGCVGIALCAVVSFQDYKIQNNNFMVKCTCEFDNVETSSSIFNFHIGDLSVKIDKQRTIKSTHVFIGFTSWCQELGLEKGCVPTKASISFEVTDGTPEAAKCKVLKCGFSLVCESDNGSWHARSMSSESDEDSSKENVDETSVVGECDNGCSSDAPGEVRRRESRLLRLLRRGWHYFVPILFFIWLCVHIQHLDSTSGCYSFLKLVSGCI